VELIEVAQPKGNAAHGTADAGEGVGVARAAEGELAPAVVCHFSVHPVLTALSIGEETVGGIDARGKLKIPVLLDPGHQAEGAALIGVAPCVASVDVVTYPFNVGSLRSPPGACVVVSEG